MNEPKTESKTPRARRVVPFTVEKQEDVGGAWKPVFAPTDPEGEFDSTASATAWIKSSGSDGKTYRVTHVTFGPVTVKTESVPKRILS